MSEIKNNNVESINFSEHIIYEHILDGHATKILRVQREGEEYTLLEVIGPSGEGGNKEATLVLMREQDPDNGGVEFLDLYNMNYPDGKQMGIRIQSRGAGQLRDFAFEFNDGVNGIKEAMRVIASSREVLFRKSIRMRSDDEQILDFADSEGNRNGYFGKLVDAIRMANIPSGSAFELKNDGNIIGYTPSGNYYLYTDNGDFYFNDHLVYNSSNLPQATQEQAEAGTDDQSYMTALKVKQQINTMIRVQDGELQFFDGSEWKGVETKKKDKLDLILEQLTEILNLLKETT